MIVDWNSVSEIIRKDMVLRFVRKENSCKMLTNLINEAKLPKTMQKAYLSVIERALNDDIQIKLAEAERNKKMPKYDTENDEVIGNLRSIMMMLTFCFPWNVAKRKGVIKL